MSQAETQPSVFFHPSFSVPSSPMARPIKKRRVMRSRGRRIAATPELKYKDFVISGAAITTGTVAFVQLSNIEEGADRDQRVGRRVRITKVEMRGGGASAGNNSYDVHLWSPRAVSDPQLSDFSPARGSFATDTGYSWFHWGYGTGTTSPYTKIPLGTDATGLNHIRYFPSGLQLYYNGIAGTNCDRNKLYFVIVCNAVSDSVGEHAHSIRVHYLDA